jgi:hypothetical protein
VAAAMATTACPSSSPISPNDGGPPDAADAGAGWQVVFDQTTLDRDLLSAWGTGPSDVYAVGGPLGNTGYLAIVLHFDGQTWHELPAGGGDTFWWVYGSGASDVWMVGEKGRITHWDGMAFTEPARVTTATVYGVWAASPTDAWAVGGTPEGGTGAPNDVLLHWDGTAWSASPLPQILGRTLFKVWGTSSDNLYAVGEAGTVWHKKGATWTLESNPPLAQGTLFTVFGCSASEVYAVGGRDVLRSDGTTWTKVDISLLNDVNGVSCAAPGAVAIDGFGGLKQRLVGGAWVDDSADPPFTDLHGLWADATGAFWAVGGDFIALPSPGKPRAGMLARYGAGTVSNVLSP